MSSPLNVCAEEPPLWADELELGRFLDPVIVFWLERRLALVFSTIDVFEDNRSKMRNLKREFSGCGRRESYDYWRGRSATSS